jgi:hypothetical protein
MRTQAKVSYQNETRVMHLANTASYAELLETVRLKFPGAYPFQIKYLDRCARRACAPFSSRVRTHRPTDPQANTPTGACMLCAWAS